MLTLLPVSISITLALQPIWSKYGQEIIVSGQSFSKWAEICKKEILSTQLGISAAVEGCLLENLLFKQDVSASAV